MPLSPRRACPPQVARIAAEAMDGYMLFTQKLVSRVLQCDEVHPDTFKGANRVFKQVRGGPAGLLWCGVVGDSGLWGTVGAWQWQLPP